MKVAIVGGGPSGLYLSLLLKRRRADWDVDVIEQNSADATFGFGVTLADSGLLQLRDADPASYKLLCKILRYSNRQTIVQDETAIEITFPGMAGAVQRLALLQLLEAEAQSVGVKIHFGKRLEHGGETLATLGLADADVIVGADGINSIVRRRYESEFQTSQRLLSNRFAWYGTRKIFDMPAIVFRKYAGGHFIGHYYAYSDDMSTFVAECDAATWHSVGLDRMTDEERQALFEKLFSKELSGTPLISNNSIWRQFPVVRNEKWVSGNHVLIGDALASAHFSIGSGTRIAMTDSIALAKALIEQGGPVEERLAVFEATHKLQKQKLIAASERSYDWYERAPEWMDTCSPEKFVYQFMTRTGRIDDERLRGEFPELAVRLGLAAA